MQLPEKATGAIFLSPSIGLLLAFALATFVIPIYRVSSHIFPLLFTNLAEKTIREFSAPSAANVATGPNVINADTHFELKPALITMVQANPFCGKAHEDANAYL